MFVLLFFYVFGGAIVTLGYDYIDVLIAGILDKCDLRHRSCRVNPTRTGLTRQVHLSTSHLSSYRPSCHVRRARLRGRATLSGLPGGKSSFSP
jgi:hypothetical protein